MRRVLVTPFTPEEIEVECDLHGAGADVHRAYRMPPANPWDIWADITDVPCPVDGCGQQLLWYEAGYVPGYRVCMARHRFQLRGERGEMVLVLEEDD